jgi:hypothetical protein
MTITGIETTEMMVDVMITTGTGTFAMMVVMIGDVDTIIVLITIETTGAVIAMYRRRGTKIESFRPMEAGVAIQVDDGSKKSGIGRHDDMITTMYLKMMIEGESGIEAKTRVAAERKIKDVTVVTAPDLHVANI